jgi:hypothetical protein
VKTPREALLLRTEIRRGVRKQMPADQLAELRFRHDVVMGLSQMEAGAELIRAAREKARAGGYARTGAAGVRELMGGDGP